MNLDNPYNLNSTELEVARCITRGLSAIGCARELHLSDRTVEHCLRCIYRKLAIPNDPLICKKVMAVNILKDFYGVG